LLAPSLAAGESPRHHPTAPFARRAEGVAPPVIDGRLDDALWAQATRLDDLRQVEPAIGAPVSERTEILLAYDARTLFVGIRCHDAEPAGIRATLCKRDVRLDSDDRVEFWFDTFHDRRNAYWFQIGAGGAKGDALITRNGAEFNKQWDAIWHGHSRLTADGWEAEVAIPLQSIAFDPATTRFGFNVARWLRRKNEQAVWASPDPQFQFFAMANGGTLTGIHGLEQSLGLDVVPFVVLDRVRQRDADRDYLRGDSGFDFFWRVTPNVKLSGSVNTDFAETEVDERRVNLTRFPLFFPEKRDFFLEDSGTFAFGGGARFGQSPDVLPFFSRRIGIDDTGEEVPIEAALKLAGRTDGWSFGLLDVQTARQHELDAQNLFVGRVSRNLFEQSDAGLIVTRGDPSGDGRAGTYGGDFNYRIDDFLGSESLRVNTWLLATEQVGAGGEAVSGHVGLALPNDEYDVGTSTTWVAQEFDPELGFVRRDGKRFGGRAFWQPRPAASAVRQWTFGARSAAWTDAGNEVESVEFDVTLVGFELQSGDHGKLTVAHLREQLEESFAIVDGVTVPAEDHRFARAGIELGTSEGRPLQARCEASGGGFYDGRSYDLEFGVNARLSRFWNAGLDWERTDANLEDGSFVARVTRLYATIQFHQDLAWTNFLQHDNLSDEIGLNSRVWWILEPGRELFLVLNHGWLRQHGSYEPVDTTLSLKLGWTLRW